MALDVERLLHWAYRDELPKRNLPDTPSMFSALLRFAELGTLIDDSSTPEPGFPAAMGETHPDAYVIAAAVQGLQPIEIDWSASRDYLLGPMAGLVDADDYVLRAMVIDPKGLIMVHARMGNRPAWGQGEAPRAKSITGANGKPVVNGMRNRRYAAGAHCPVMWTPDPRALAADRAEYVAWHSALVRLAKDLEQRGLERWRVTPPAASPCPWSRPDVVPRVLPDLTAPPIAASRPVQRRRRSIERIAA